MKFSRNSQLVLGFVGVFGFFIRHRLLKSEYENHKKFKNEKAKHSRIDTT